nr:hypothetical protein [uncultured Anaerocolumna sp.]
MPTGKFCPQASLSAYATSSTTLPLRGISAGALTTAETGKSLPDEVK